MRVTATVAPTVRWRGTAGTRQSGWWWPRAASRPSRTPLWATCWMLQAILSLLVSWASCAPRASSAPTACWRPPSSAATSPSSRSSLRPRPRLGARRPPRRAGAADSCRWWTSPFATATSTWLPRSFAMDCGLMTLPGRGLTCRCTQAAPATALQPRSWPCCPRRRPPSPCCQRRPRGVGLPHSATGTWSRRTTAPQPSPPPPGTPSSASSRACCHPSMPSPAAPPSPRTKRRWHRWHFPPADRSSRCPSG
mmetsp:Transcript_16102/g.48497  ORF Transcript_16102/g.48497 Transcript_16102/m.48497 type:complete len:251 (+) Transcript_16102:814-1566(+)